MTKLIAVLLALVFAAGLLVAPDAIAQTTKSTTKSGTKSSTTTDKSTATDTKTATKGGKLDINTASEAELKALPGIGDAYAKKIMDNRPYKRKDEIVKKAGVPQATYDKIKDQIIAHQVKSDTSGSASTSTTTKKKQ